MSIYSIFKYKCVRPILQREKITFFLKYLVSLYRKLLRKMVEIFNLALSLKAFKCRLVVKNHYPHLTVLDVPLIYFFINFFLSNLVRLQIFFFQI